MASLNTFEIINDDIHIHREEWPFVGMTSYREDYYPELSSVTWTWRKKDNYLNNNNLGLLHRYVMEKWYGKEILDDMTGKGYVVEHMNNVHYDCRITNLTFLKKTYNTAKAQSFDIDSLQMRHRIALSMFNDFSTNCYQITIGCNDTIAAKLGDGKEVLINAILLLYDCDYSIVVNDAENILRVYETQGIIDVRRTYACDVKIRTSVYIQLTEEEKGQSFVIRDGVAYMVLGTGTNYIDSVYYEKGWLPPSEK